MPVKGRSPPGPFFRLDLAAIHGRYLILAGERSLRMKRLLSIALVLLWTSTAHVR